MYSIKPIIRDDKPIKENGKYPVYFLIRLDKIQLKIPAKKDVESKYWDKKSGKVLKGHPDYILNKTFSKRMTEFSGFMESNELSGRNVTKEMVKQFFHGNMNRSFYDFYLDQVNSWKSRLRMSTQLVYSTTLKILKEYRANVSFNDIDYNFIVKFDQYLREVRENSDSGVFNRHKCLKAVIRTAIHRDYILKNPYDSFKIKHVERRKEFLNLEEVQKIVALKIPDTKKHLEKIKDAFLFSCFTGLRFSDVVNLEWINICNDRIEFVMMKTNKSNTVPLIKQSREILNKYKKLSENNETSKIFLTISNQKTNEMLKELMKMCGINKRVTFHIARHSFASMLVELGVHLIDIKEMCGHSSIVETEIYAKSNKDNLVSSLKKFENVF